VHAVAIVPGAAGRGDVIDHRTKRREHRRQFGNHIGTKRPEHGSIDRSEIVVACVAHDRKRQVVFKLRRPAFEYEISACVGTLSQLEQEARLADPWLADDLQEPRLAVLEPIESSLELG
jgi:hypothetical protein